jgi:5-(carboxyamino)imidazole ribonucleotide mutase
MNPPSSQSPTSNAIFLRMTTPQSPLVGIIMGSKSDFEYLAPACEMLTHLGIPYEAKVLSAHRTPDQTLEYSATAEGRGLVCIIAAAGGAAHLAGVIASKTLLPVLGVPIPSTSLNGLDSLLSIVQMPAGIPVGTLAIGKPGATNAAIFAAEIIGCQKPEVRQKLRAWRESRARDVLAQTLP